MVNWTDYIETNEKIGFGKPILKGTRLSVEFIIGLFANGWTENQIMENYPNVNKYHFIAIFTYLSELLKDGFLFDVNTKSA
jgi:uncharacterized protein (DUF433 family)